MDIQSIQAFAEEIARQTGEKLLLKQAQGITQMSKGFRDVVTDADIEAQAFLTGEIQRQYPSHGFVTEEDDDTLPTTGDVIWIIDPIDGTSNFGNNMPIFSISIAAAVPLEEGADLLNIIVGVVYDPSRQELFSAAKGFGASCNGKPIAVSVNSEPIKTTLAIDLGRDPQSRTTMMGILSSLIHDIKTMRSIGTAALALAYVAAGRLDGYVHLTLQLWDVAAGQLLIKEAGGVVTDVHGTAWHSDMPSVLGTNKNINPFLVERFKSLHAA